MKAYSSMRANRADAITGYTDLLDLIEESQADIRKKLGLRKDLLTTKNIEEYNEAHKLAKDWYGYIPPFGSDPFISYITASRELALIVADIEELRVHIADTDIMGRADQKQNIIHLSRLLFSRDWMRSIGITNKKDQATMAVATVNGVLLHEAAHFALSDSTIRDSIKRLGIDEPKSGTLKNILYTAINVGEDIYIEDWLIENYPYYKAFIQASHEYFFSDLELVSRLSTLIQNAELDDTYSGPGGPKKNRKRKCQFRGPLFLDLLVMLKSWRIDEYDFGSAIVPYQEMFRNFKGTEDREDRARLALDLSRKLVDDPLLIWPEDSSTASVLAVSQAGGVETEGFDRDTRSVAASEEVAEKLIGKIGALSEEEKKTVRKIADALKKATIKIELKSDDSLKGVPPILVEKAEEHYSKEQPDPRFLSLGQSLRYALTRNYAPGEPRKKGTVLVPTRLSRIITDGKIFSYYEKRPRTAKDYEVVILVDVSGSMSGDKVKEAMQVGVASYISLRRARVFSQIFSHTSKYDLSPDTPILYILGGPKDSFDKVLKRAATFTYASSRLLRNNYDGFAIKKAVEIGFTDKPRRKWLIVVSDGHPAGDGYGGEPAIIQTGEAVDQARRRGVDVVSITIARGAWKVNDRIYGAKKNVKTTDVKVLHDLITAMFIRGGKRHGKEKVGHKER